MKPKSAKNMIVELYKDEVCLGSYSIPAAAAKMGIPEKELIGFINGDGYCVVDEPFCIEARLEPREVSFGRAALKRFVGR